MIGQLQRGAAEGDHALVIHHFIGQRRERVLQYSEAFFRPFVRDDDGAGILERFAAGDVVVVVMAVNQVFDRLVGDLFDFVDISGHRLRPAVADGVSGNHAGGCDDEHRLVVAIAEHIDVVGAFDLGGGKQRRFFRGCGSGFVLGAGAGSKRQGDAGKQDAQHV